MVKKREFFGFSSKYVSSTLQAYLVGNYDHLNLVKGKYEGIQFPVIFKQEYGKQLRDILDTGTAALYLISDRLKTILEENKLTGWKTFPIKIYGKDGNEIPGYSGLSITGQCGPIYYNDSTIIEKRLVPKGPVCRFYRGQFINEDQWDGTDFFSPIGKYHLFVTKRAANILKKEKITNLVLENTADIEIDADLVNRKKTN